MGPYWGPCLCGRHPEALKAACVNYPILSQQKRCKCLSEIAALWVTIMLCGLKGKPKLGGTQEPENVLGNEGTGFVIGGVGVTASRVERETSLMQNLASRALCDMAPAYLIFLFSMEVKSSGSEVREIRV